MAGANKRRAVVAANWKMHGASEMVDAYADRWPGTPSGVDVVLCPPFGYLARLISAFGDRAVRFGVQDTAVEASGAFTGEHSPEMARDLGAEFAIVGHSERRRLFGETDAPVAAKFEAARRAGLAPILCVGETLGERREGNAVTVVQRQLDAVVDRCGAESLADAIIAYEPVWAIGTGETATPAQAEEMHQAIRTRLGKENGALAGAVRIVYGGSVNARNAPDLFAEPDIDGALVGGASLDAVEFAGICSAAL